MSSWTKLGRSKLLRLSTTSLVMLMLTMCGRSQCQDFQFDANTEDDMQIMFTDVSEVIHHNHTESRSLENDIIDCPYSSKKLMLTLVLRSHSWDEVIDKKRERAVQKLATFFAVPKEYIDVENLNRRNVHEMLKFAVRPDSKALAELKKLGKLEFMIGCGKTYFEAGKLIANQIGKQIEDGSISDISGLDFGWWVIWSKHFNVNNRVPRNRRAVTEGSGEYDEEDYNDEYDGEDEELPTEKPINGQVDGRIPLELPPNRDILTNQSAEESIVENDLPGSNSVFPEAQPTTIGNNDLIDSVSELESVISKTIENTKKPMADTELNADVLKQHAANDNEIVPLVETVLDDERIEIASRKPVGAVVVNEEKRVEEPGVENSFTVATTEVATEYSTVVTTLESVAETTTELTLTTTTPKRLTTTEDAQVVSTTETLQIIAETVTPTSNVQLPTITTTTVPIVITKSQPINESSISTSTIKASATSETVVVVTSTEPISSTKPVLVDIDLNEPKASVGDEATTPSATNNHYDDEDDDLYDNYDEEDEFDDKVKTTATQATEPKTTERSIVFPNVVATTTEKERTAVASTTVVTSTITTTAAVPIVITTTEYVEPEPTNYPPVIRNRMPKQPVTAGRPFNFIVPLETFDDIEDGTDLKLTLLDKSDHMLKSNSWIQFKPDTREIYGLPLEDAVSKWQFKLRAADSMNETVTETLDISVQQHKSHRSANHEISVGVKLHDKYISNVDWQIRLIDGIAKTLGDASSAGIVVREIRHNAQEPNVATLVYTNDTLPKDKCPDEILDELFKRLTVKSLSEHIQPEMGVKFISGKPIGSCVKSEVTKPKVAKPTPHMIRNFPPVPRNQVDRVNASVGQLLVFKVPADTFYDPEDNTDLQLSLLSMERTRLEPKHWLQFDAKNNEFYGIPKYGDVGQREYLLVATDSEGLTANDALVVVVNQPAHRENYNTIFEMTLGIDYDDFNNSSVQRTFVERIAQIFGDATATDYIHIRSIRKVHPTGKTMVSYYNSTLHRPHHVCPTDTIAKINRVLLNQDGSIAHRVTDTLGADFDVLLVKLVPFGACIEAADTVRHAMIPIGGKADDGQSFSFKDDYLLTFVLPAIIIVVMLLLASIIACVLHRRRITGKMELGDEEERRSFRSKGIPVIFQDELDEKPDISNKSPIILKDEKPPLLPPTYNSTNPDDNDDMDEYLPPPAVVMNGRESRGKSPVTPSYRKPPPYVSP